MFRPSARNTTSSWPIEASTHVPICRDEGGSAETRARLATREYAHPVTDAAVDSELPVGPKAGAYLLGMVAIASCVRLIVLAAGAGAVTGEHLVWLAVCVIAAAFSAACAVVAWLKSSTESSSRVVE